MTSSEGQDGLERAVIGVVPWLVSGLVVLGIWNSITARSGNTFEASALVTFVGDIFMAGSMHAGVYYAYRSKSMASEHTNERFVPSVTAGISALVFMLFLDHLTIQKTPVVLVGRDTLTVSLIWLITLLALLWDVLVVRRSIADGAWRGTRRPPPPSGTKQ
jgi:hypothetical protein